MDFEISAGQVKALLKQGDKLTLLDVREPWELEKAHLEGTTNIPMGDIPARANQELDPDAHIVVVCHHGVRSLSVTNWLRQQGFEMCSPCAAESMAGRGLWIRRCHCIESASSFWLLASSCKIRQRHCGFC